MQTANPALNDKTFENFGDYRRDHAGEQSPAGRSATHAAEKIPDSLIEAGAKQMVHARSSLKSIRNTTVMFYRGDVLCGWANLSDKKGMSPYIPPSLVEKTLGSGSQGKACEVALKPAKLKLHPARWWRAQPGRRRPNAFRE